MKYSFLSSAPEWPPSALMMAVSASGASSEPLASWVRYVPVGGRSEPNGGMGVAERKRKDGRRCKIADAIKVKHRNCKMELEASRTERQDVAAPSSK